MTALFNDIIFGPIRSRRLGISLGVNLLPTASKLCNFECVYCECGWSGAKNGTKNTPARFNSRADVNELLGEKLREMAAKNECPDVITFAGNGEPTMHPDFEAIIDDTIELRDEICPKTKISVLSNATMIGRESVRRALARVDNNILKLDSAFDRTVRLIDNPPADYSVAQTVRNMKLFTPRPIIQTMFLRGQVPSGQSGAPSRTVDNTTEDEVSAWLTLLQDIEPQSVMIYTIDRDTPLHTLEKIPLPQLNTIATRVRALGISVSVSG